MKLPQFSAESSLYRTRAHYYTAGSGVPGGQIVPQQAGLSSGQGELNIWWCCYIWCWGYWCWYYCRPCGWGVGGTNTLQ
jgi:hypothetical protein